MKHPTIAGIAVIIYFLGIGVLSYSVELFGLNDMRPLIIWLFAGFLVAAGTIGLTSNKRR